MHGDAYSLSIKWPPYHFQNICQKRYLSSRDVAVVIITSMCSVVWLPLASVTFRTEKLKVVATSVIFTWCVQLRSSWHHNLKLQTQRHLHKLIHAKHKPCGTQIEKAGIISNRSVYAHCLIPAMRLQSFKYGGSDNVQYIPWTRCPGRHIQRELWGTIFNENMLRVIMGIMNGLIGGCLWSTFGLRANDYVKHRTNCVIRSEPSDVSQTTPPHPWSLSPRN